MRRYLLALLKLSVFWMVFFFLGRLAFLMVYAYLWQGVPLAEVASCFVYAFRLDVSTLCYLSAIPLLLLTGMLATKSRWISVLMYVVLLLSLLVCSLILVGEIAVYGEWLCKLNYKILLYLRHPVEILTTAGVARSLLFLLVVGLMTAVGFWLMKRWAFSRPVQPLQSPLKKMIPAFLIGGGLCFLGMRGGLDAIPISQSSAYYSTHSVLNDAAVNPHYNLICSFYDFGGMDEEMFAFGKEEDARKRVAAMYACEKDTLCPIWDEKPQNIVLILLESWTADVVESISGVKGVTDCFHSLEKEGILFTDFYTNGHRSQQAMSSIFSGFPALPVYDITDDFSKYSHLPSFPEHLSKEGFYTSFYFGGNLDYGNIRSYLMQCGFDQIVEEKQMDKALPRGNLGIHDQYTFPIFHKALNAQTPPFMSVLFTLSSHSPYDQPDIVDAVDIRHPEKDFLTSAKYCDAQLGRFFDSVRKEPWYSRTLFVIVGDHGHPTHLEKNHLEPDYQRIPLLLYGDVISRHLRGSRMGVLGSHVDLAKTLLCQLGLPADDFVWGKDLFNPYSPQFVYYETYTGYGWIRPGAAFAEFKPGKDWRSRGYGDSSQYSVLQKEGRAYLQCLYRTYLDF